MLKSIKWFGGFNISLYLCSGKPEGVEIEAWQGGLKQFS